VSPRTFIIAYFALLFLLHQDFWWRNDPRLVFGILPVSLAYHVAWTILIAAGWLFVAKFCWPRGLDEPPRPRSAADHPNPEHPAR
jgi:hypothetical protein